MDEEKTTWQVCETGKLALSQLLKRQQEDLVRLFQVMASDAGVPPDTKISFSDGVFTEA